MAIRPEFVEELKLLSLFNLDSIQEGIKIHHEAGADKVEAAQRACLKRALLLRLTVAT